MKDYHKIEIEVTGPTTANNSQFKVNTVRMSPSASGQVTSTATLGSFMSSLISKSTKQLNYKILFIYNLDAVHKGPGFHLC